MNIESMRSVKVNSMMLKAEELYRKRNPERAFPKTESGVMRLLHELEVHRIELEMQNEELQLAIAKMEESEAHLREVNATKDKLFSIISHDLRSPFSSIIGFSNLLVECVSKKDYSGIREYARIIRDSSWRVMDLLMNLLEWSNSQTGKMEYNPQYINLIQLIKEVKALSAEGAEQKSITILSDLPKKVMVFADKAMISTVLRNLFSNALKFTHVKGTIRIGVKQSQSEVLISLSDNGIGLSAQMAEKIFVMEESYTTLGTQREQGSGLGLMLCRDFVLKHKGKIWVESELGKGSTFYFTIPSI